MKVIDVSEHNGNIDYAKVKADGVDGVIIRAGYGKGNVDKKFTANITGAIKNNLKIGIYWFSYAYTEDMARAEAKYCDEIITTYKSLLEMPVFFDWEYDSMKFAKKNNVNPDKDLITGMTKAFCEEIKELGYDAGYYLNLDYAKNYYFEDELKDYKKWFARYVKKEQKDCYLWQNSNKGQIDGIKGDVDTDVLWGDLSGLSGEIGIISPKEEISQEKADDVDKQSDLPYEVGKTYTIKVKSALNVRKGAGKGFGLVGYNGLTADGKKHAFSNGALRSGTKVTVKEVKVNNDHDVWVRIPSGWICAIDGNKIFVV